MTEKSDTQKNKAHIIAGGGLAGLYAARTLKNLGAQNVYLIEKEKSTGGLLQSISIENPLGDGTDYNFDYGTHFVLTTAEPDVDDVLFQDLDRNDYQEFKNSLHEGQYIAGRYYGESGCANMQLLPEAVKEKSLAELEQMEALEENAKHETLEDVLLERYGPTATREIYAPVFEKLTGLTIDALDPCVEQSFFPARMIIKDREESVRLKQKPFWDKRIAFNSYKDSTSPILKFYPQNGAIGYWPITMTENLVADGVNVLTDTSIETLEHDGQNIYNVTLSDGTTLECAELIWTLPPVFLSFLTKTGVPMAKPLMRSVAVLHYLTDIKPQSDAFWVTVYDTAVKPYRITLYDNFQPGKGNEAYRISVEILHDGSFLKNKEHEEEIFAELVEMGIISKKAKMLWSHSTNKDNALAVLTPRLKKTQLEQIHILENRFGNAHIAGRRPDSGHGQMAVMKNVYETLKCMTQAHAE